MRIYKLIILIFIFIIQGEFHCIMAQAAKDQETILSDDSNRTTTPSSRIWLRTAECLYIGYSVFNYNNLANEPSSNTGNKDILLKTAKCLSALSLITFLSACVTQETLEYNLKYKDYYFQKETIILGATSLCLLAASRFCYKRYDKIIRVRLSGDEEIQSNVSLSLSPVQFAIKMSF